LGCVGLAYLFHGRMDCARAERKNPISSGAECRLEKGRRQPDRRNTLSYTQSLREVPSVFPVGGKRGQGRGDGAIDCWRGKQTAGEKATKEIELASRTFSIS